MIKKIITVNGEEVEASEEYYLRNPNLPKTTSTYTYTENMLREVDKCREDIIYFAEKYFYIINMMTGRKEVIKLFPKQKEILTNIQRNKKIALITSRQYGKCLHLDNVVGIRLTLLKYLKLKFNIKIGTLYKIFKLINWLKFWKKPLKKCQKMDKKD